MAASAEDASDVALLAEAAREAAAIGMRFFGRTLDVRYKLGGTAAPVSEADLAIDRMLREHLQAARPHYGWLSEETEDDQSRLAHARTFVVDPIDGTRAFLAGESRWTVSLAVVENGRPVAAALARPVKGELYTAAAGGGAALDGRLLSIADRDALAGARGAVPRSFPRRAAIEAAGVDIRGFVPSLALRLAFVAAGRLDFAFAGGRANDWDLAAADLLVHEAGARLTYAEGGTPHYNRLETEHPPLVATLPGLVQPIRDLIAPAAGQSGAGNRLSLGAKLSRETEAGSEPDRPDPPRAGGAA